MENAKQEKDFNKAKTAGYRLLTFRPRSEHELREQFTSRKLPNPVIEQTIQYFKDTNLIDDRQFARQWTFSRLKKPFGLNRIRIELEKKGINTIVIEEVLAESSKNYNELDIVTDLARHRAIKYKDITAEKSRQRLYGYLQRRGFNTNIILKVINTL